MNLRDYNGGGRWSRDGILRRYAQLVRKLNIPPRDLSPDEIVRGDDHWVYPVMDKVIEGIAAGDRGCIEIGIDFIEESGSFTFGAILKSNTARALRRASLTDAQKHRIRRRVFGMLRAGYVPREFKEYAKLVRSIGYKVEEVRGVTDENPRVARFRRYFETHPA